MKYCPKCKVKMVKVRVKLKRKYANGRELWLKCKHCAKCKFSYVLDHYTQ